MYKIDEISSLMSKHLSNCPICKSTSNYSVIDVKKLKVKCTHCGATWLLFIGPGNNELIALQLLIIDKSKTAKSLKDTVESLGFWQYSDLLTMNESLKKEIKKTFQQYMGAFSENKKIEVIQKLSVFGDLAVLHLMGTGICYSVTNRALLSKLLKIVREIANPICLPDLIRTLNSGYPNVDRHLIVHTILNIIPNLKEKSEYKEFFIDVCRYDTDRSISDMALHGLQDLGLLSTDEMNDLIPIMLERIEKDKDPNSRISGILGLQEFIDNPQVISFLLKSLSDEAVPDSDPIVAGSLTGLLVAAAKSKPKASVGEVAANILLESSDKDGILGLIDFILDGGLGQKIHDHKINKLLESGPYVVEHLNEKLNSNVEIQRIMAHKLLSSLKNIEE